LLKVDHRETVQLWNYTSGASVIQRLDLRGRGVEDWHATVGDLGKGIIMNNVVLL